MLPIKTLKEISNEIGEELGIIKKFNSKNGYYINAFREPEITLYDTKIHLNISFRNANSVMSGGFFKSKKGYNSKYKNNKEFANHYAEYISYLILKQLGKKACKVDLGEIEIRNRYSNKTVNVEGVLSHYDITEEESFKTIREIIESYKKEYPEKYKKMIVKEHQNSERNYSNIEIILNSLEDFCIRNEQKDKITEVRKDFFDMCIYDLIFANRDRHDENLGIKVNKNTNEINFYALFDNEQILGMQEDKRDIIKYMSNEREYKKFKNKYLTSFIGIPGEIQKVMPQKLLHYMLENYYKETVDSLQDIERYQFSDLEEVLEVCPNLSKEHKDFAKKIFKERQIEIKHTENEFKSQMMEQKECDNLPEL